MVHPAFPELLVNQDQRDRKDQEDPKVMLEHKDLKEYKVHLGHQDQPLAGQASSWTGQESCQRVCLDLRAHQDRKDLKEIKDLREKSEMMVKVLFPSCSKVFFEGLKALP